jgi:phosphopantothenoylcysteine decarboxylase/phosphopantothenate--cysteine ligase
MLEPWQIEEHVGRALGTEAAFRDRRVLVTAGPTREPVDPVRYVGNRSSGRMGYALAQAAWRRGAQVTLVSGPSKLPWPEGVDVVAVETAVEMHDAVRELVGAADVSVFAAAVADFRPEGAGEAKLKRSEVGDRLTLTLVSNPDVAGDTRSLRREGAVAVGFALETHDLVENARKKLSSKGFDLLVANDATAEGSGFDVDTNRVSILSADGSVEALPLQSKDEVAEEVLDRVARLLEPGS